jgi:hypothetical protein
MLFFWSAKKTPIASVLQHLSKIVQFVNTSRQATERVEQRDDFFPLQLEQLLVIEFLREEDFQSCPQPARL